jgi:hypothetical protein
VLAEVDVSVVQRRDQALAIENVDSHRSLEELRVFVFSELRQERLGTVSLSRTFGSFGFSTKRIIFRSASVCMIPKSTLPHASPGSSQWSALRRSRRAA